MNVKSESIAELAAALAAAQSEMKPALMDKSNPFLKNKYADLGSVIEAARQPLAKHGLAFTQLVTGDAASIGLETMLIHASCQLLSTFVTLPVGDIKGISLAQGVGSIITYLRRYALAAMLGVYADEDTDGNASEQKKSPAKPTVKPAQTGPEPAAEQPWATPAAAWQTAVEAYAWAIAAGACDNEHEARNSFKKIVDQHFKGELKTNDKAAAFEMFYARQIEKLAERNAYAEQADAQPA